MISELLKSHDFKVLVDEMKAGYTQVVMARDVSEEDRADALARFHLLDEIVIELSAKAFSNSQGKKND